MSVNALRAVFGEVKRNPDGTRYLEGGSRSKGAAAFVAVALADWSDDEGRSYPSVDALAVKARMTTRGVRKALTTLVALGELSVLPSAGPNHVNVYQLNLDTLNVVQGERGSGGTKVTQGVNDVPGRGERRSQRGERGSANTSLYTNDTSGIHKRTRKRVSPPAEIDSINTPLSTPEQIDAICQKLRAANG